ncbi:hypothetical protein Clacol_008067 [Clathrus columnatus]|uniref:Trafficking protein particle complex subunit 6B n=1 Tax=Clathrus columnatus TaxID=1419009 RepID=A0AAV5APH7_9AGAM|nr:hypothetical protein Clacol_008067 [Clathrus columnatus]
MSSTPSTSVLPASLGTLVDPPLLGSPITLSSSSGIPNTFGQVYQNTGSLPPAPLILAPPKIDISVQDYLLIEAVNTLRASSAAARERIKTREEEMIREGLLVISASGSSAGGPNTPILPNTPGKHTISAEEEDLRVRLDAMGAHVGANIAERLLLDKARFNDTLDAIKFLCKDVWMALWEKQIDNLRTNHRGVYVLQDNTFRPIMRISSAEGPSDSLKRAKIYTALPAGVLRGALSRLGIQATVTTEILLLPQCTFQVKLPKGT